MPKFWLKKHSNFPDPNKRLVDVYNVLTRGTMGCVHAGPARLGMGVRVSCAVFVNTRLGVTFLGACHDDKHF